MAENEFADNKKEFESFLKGAEGAAMNFLVPKVPTWVSSKHLTLASIPLSLGVIICGFNASANLNWLYLFSILIFLHWLTDVLDGSVARYRKENEPKWGFYMDHFLDYVFMCSFVIGYSFLLEDSLKIWAYSLIPLMGALMVSEYLRFGAIKKFNIAHYGFGPIEMQASLIVLNFFLIYFGTGLLERVMPALVLISLLAVIVTVYKNQKEILKIDRASK